MNAITRAELAQLDSPAVSFELNGRAVSARADQSLLEIAKEQGIAIPHLCHKDGLQSVGNCRSCMVEIAGERVLAASCCRTPTAGMKVTTDSERAVKSQKLVLEEAHRVARRADRAVVVGEDHDGGRADEAAVRLQRVEVERNVGERRRQDAARRAARQVSVESVAVGHAAAELVD